MPETREVSGTVFKITPIKQLKPNFYSASIILQEEKGKNIYHNVVGNNPNEIMNTIKFIKPGDKVTLLETKRGNYWNVIQVVTQSKEEIKGTVEVHPDEIKRIFKDSIKEALEIANELFPMNLTEWKTALTPGDVLELAIFLYQQKTKVR